MQTICVVAGKSGGHLIPALTYAQQLRTDNPTARVVIISNDTALDATIVKSYPWISQACSINCGSTNKRGIWRYPTLAYQCAKACITAYRFLRATKTTTIISTGGLIGIPVCIVGRLLGCSVILYELNSVPGRAAHIIGRFAKHIYCTFSNAINYFPRSLQQRCSVVAYPIRFTIIPTRDESLNTLNETYGTILFPHRFTITLLGGSQGSQFLNDVLIHSLERLPNVHNTIQIIHQTGSIQNSCATWYREHNIPAIVFPFTHNIAACYQSADIVIGRAGAGTLFETLHFSKRSCVIPLITATTSHQADNALAMVHAYPQFFSVITQRDITTTAQELASLLERAITEYTLNNH